MSLVTDRRCDGCKAIQPRSDREWLAVIPPGWDGEYHRLDFCDINCLRDAVWRRDFENLVTEKSPDA